ncbi:transcriptional regulator with XRE-family HTH domain [Bradyrhizobium japonicum]
MPKAKQSKYSSTKQRSATSLDSLIGQKIRARRLELHISQQELGEKLGVSFQQVQKYEKGVNRVGAGRLQQICNVLDASMSYFMEDGNGRTAPTKMSAFMATKEGVDIAEAMMKLKEPHARAIIALARTLATAYA